MSMELAMLTAMGFPRSHCTQALAACDGNVEVCVNWLFSNRARFAEVDAAAEAGEFIFYYLCLFFILRDSQHLTRSPSHIIWSTSHRRGGSGGRHRGSISARSGRRFEGHAAGAFCPRRSWRSWRSSCRALGARSRQRGLALAQRG